MSRTAAEDLAEHLAETLDRLEREGCITRAQRRDAAALLFVAELARRELAARDVRALLDRIELELLGLEPP